MRDGMHVCREGRERCLHAEERTNTLHIEWYPRCENFQRFHQIRTYIPSQDCQSQSRIPSDNDRMVQIHRPK